MKLFLWPLQASTISGKGKVENKLVSSLSGEPIPDWKNNGCPRKSWLTGCLFHERLYMLLCRLQDSIQGLEMERTFCLLCLLWAEAQGFPLAKELQGIGVLGIRSQRWHSVASAVRVSRRTIYGSSRKNSLRAFHTTAAAQELSVNPRRLQSLMEKSRAG